MDTDAPITTKSTVEHNWPVYGHDWAVEYLREGIEYNRTRHAYLITGATSIGKMTLARAFAMTLNCAAEMPVRPCGVCRSCKLLHSGNHPDLLYAETDPNTGALKIDTIRALIGRIVMKPYESRWRIAILEHFDYAQGPAQDALLKTLEEPPPQAILILLATATEKLLPTIVSRSQVIALRPVAAAVIQKVLLTQYAVEEEQAALLARLSGGRIGWAIAAAQNSTRLDQRNEAIDLLDSILRMNRSERFAIADQLSEDKPALLQLLELWQTYWRDVLLLVEKSPVKLCNVDRTEVMQDLVKTISPEEALTALRATQTLLQNLAYNVNVRLALEILFLDYPGLTH